MAISNPAIPICAQCSSNQEAASISPAFESGLALWLALTNRMRWRWHCQCRASPLRGLEASSFSLLEASHSGLTADCKRQHKREIVLAEENCGIPTDSQHQGPRHVAEVRLDIPPHGAPDEPPAELSLVPDLCQHHMGKNPLNHPVWHTGLKEMMNCYCFK